LDYMEGFDPDDDALDYVENYFSGADSGQANIVDEFNADPIYVHFFIDDESDHVGKIGSIHLASRERTQWWFGGHNRDTTHVYLQYVDRIDTPENMAGAAAQFMGAAVAKGRIYEFVELGEFSPQQYWKGEAVSILHEIGHCIGIKKWEGSIPLLRKEKYANFFTEGTTWHSWISVMASFDSCIGEISGVGTFDARDPSYDKEVWWDLHSLKHKWSTDWRAYMP